MTLKYLETVYVPGERKKHRQDPDRRASDELLYALALHKKPYPAAGIPRSQGWARPRDLGAPRYEYE